MSDAITKNLTRGRLCSLNRVLSGCTVQEYVQLRDFGNPTPIDFTIEFDRQLHGHSLTPIPRPKRRCYR